MLLLLLGVSFSSSLSSRKIVMDMKNGLPITAKCQQPISQFVRRRRLLLLLVLLPPQIGCGCCRSCWHVFLTMLLRLMNSSTNFADIQNLHIIFFCWLGSRLLTNFINRCSPFSFRSNQFQQAHLPVPWQCFSAAAAAVGIRRRARTLPQPPMSRQISVSCEVFATNLLAKECDKPK
jgi:hypothetical protein